MRFKRFIALFLAVSMLVLQMPVVVLASTPSSPSAIPANQDATTGLGSRFYAFFSEDAVLNSDGVQTSTTYYLMKDSDTEYISKLNGDKFKNSISEISSLYVESKNGEVFDTCAGPSCELTFLNNKAYHKHNINGLASEYTEQGTLYSKYYQLLGIKVSGDGTIYSSGDYISKNEVTVKAYYLNSAYLSNSNYNVFSDYDEEELSAALQNQILREVTLSSEDYTLVNYTIDADFIENKEDATILFGSFNCKLGVNLKLEETQIISGDATSSASANYATNGDAARWNGVTNSIRYTYDNVGKTIEDVTGKTSDDFKNSGDYSFAAQTPLYRIHYTPYSDFTSGDKTFNALSGDFITSGEYTHSGEYSTSGDLYKNVVTVEPAEKILKNAGKYEIEIIVPYVYDYNQGGVQYSKVWTKTYTYTVIIEKANLGITKVTDNVTYHLASIRNHILNRTVTGVNNEEVFGQFIFAADADAAGAIYTQEFCSGEVWGNNTNGFISASHKQEIQIPWEFNLYNAQDINNYLCQRDGAVRTYVSGDEEYFTGNGQNTYYSGTNGVILFASGDETPSIDVDMNVKLTYEEDQNDGSATVYESGDRYFNKGKSTDTAQITAIYGEKFKIDATLNPTVGGAKKYSLGEAVKVGDRVDNAIILLGDAEEDFFEQAAEGKIYSGEKWTIEFYGINASGEKVEVASKTITDTNKSDGLLSWSDDAIKACEYYGLEKYTLEINYKGLHYASDTSTDARKATWLGTEKFNWVTAKASYDVVIEQREVKLQNLTDIDKIYDGTSLLVKQDVNESGDVIDAKPYVIELQKDNGISDTQFKKDASTILENFVQPNGYEVDPDNFAMNLEIAGTYMSKSSDHSGDANSNKDIKILNARLLASGDDKNYLNYKLVDDNADDSTVTATANGDIDVANMYVSHTKLPTISTYTYVPSLRDAVGIDLRAYKLEVSGDSGDYFYSDAALTSNYVKLVEKDAAGTNDGIYDYDDYYTLVVDKSSLSIVKNGKVTSGLEIKEDSGEIIDFARNNSTNTDVKEMPTVKVEIKDYGNYTAKLNSESTWENYYAKCTKTGNNSKDTENEVITHNLHYRVIGNSNSYAMFLPSVGLNLRNKASEYINESNRNINVVGNDIVLGSGETATDITYKKMTIDQNSKIRFKFTIKQDSYLSNVSIVAVPNYSYDEDGKWDNMMSYSTLLEAAKKAPVLVTNASDETENLGNFKVSGENVTLLDNKLKLTLVEITNDSGDVLGTTTIPDSEDQFGGATYTFELETSDDNVGVNYPIVVVPVTAKYAPMIASGDLVVSGDEAKVIASFNVLHNLNGGSGEISLEYASEKFTINDTNTESGEHKFEINPSDYSTFFDAEKLLPGTSVTIKVTMWREGAKAGMQDSGDTDPDVYDEYTYTWNVTLDEYKKLFSDKLVIFAEHSGDNTYVEFGYGIADYPTTLDFEDIEKYLSKDGSGDWKLTDDKNLIAAESEFWEVYSGDTYSALELVDNKLGDVETGTIFVAQKYDLFGIVASQSGDQKYEIGDEVASGDAKVEAYYIRKDLSGDSNYSFNALSGDLETYITNRIVRKEILSSGDFTLSNTVIDNDFIYGKKEVKATYNGFESSYKPLIEIDDSNENLQHNDDVDAEYPTAGDASKFNSVNAYRVTYDGTLRSIEDLIEVSGDVLKNSGDLARYAKDAIYYIEYKPYNTFTAEDTTYDATKFNVLTKGIYTLTSKDGLRNLKKISGDSLSTTGEPMLKYAGLYNITITIPHVWDYQTLNDESWVDEYKYTLVIQKENLHITEVTDTVKTYTRVQNHVVNRNVKGVSGEEVEGRFTFDARISSSGENWGNSEERFVNSNAPLAKNIKWEFNVIEEIDQNNYICQLDGETRTYMDGTEEKFTNDGFNSYYSGTNGILMYSEDGVTPTLDVDMGVYMTYENEHEISDFPFTTVETKIDNRYFNHGTSSITDVVDTIFAEEFSIETLINPSGEDSIGEAVKVGDRVDGAVIYGDNAEDFFTVTAEGKTYKGERWTIVLSGINASGESVVVASKEVSDLNKADGKLSWVDDAIKACRYYGLEKYRLDITFKGLYYTTDTSEEARKASWHGTEEFNWITSSASFNVIVNPREITFPGDLDDLDKIYDGSDLLVRQVLNESGDVIDAKPYIIELQNDNGIADTQFNKDASNVLSDFKQPYGYGSVSDNFAINVEIAGKYLPFGDNSSDANILKDVRMFNIRLLPSGDDNNYLNYKLYEDSEAVTIPTDLPVGYGNINVANMYVSHAKEPTLTVNAKTPSLREEVGLDVQAYKLVISGDAENYYYKDENLLSSKVQLIEKKDAVGGSYDYDDYYTLILDGNSSKIINSGDETEGLKISGDTGIIEDYAIVHSNDTNVNNMPIVKVEVKDYGNYTAKLIGEEDWIADYNTCIKSGENTASVEDEIVTHMLHYKVIGNENSYAVFLPYDGLNGRDKDSDFLNYLDEQIVTGSGEKATDPDMNYKWYTMYQNSKTQIKFTIKQDSYLSNVSIIAIPNYHYDQNAKWDNMVSFADLLKATKEKAVLSGDITGKLGNLGNFKVSGDEVTLLDNKLKLTLVKVEDDAGNVLNAGATLIPSANAQKGGATYTFELETMDDVIGTNYPIVIVPTVEKYSQLILRSGDAPKLEVADDGSKVTVSFNSIYDLLGGSGEVTLSYGTENIVLNDAIQASGEHSIDAVKASNASFFDVEKLLPGTSVSINIKLWREGSKAGHQTTGDADASDEYSFTWTVTIDEYKNLFKDKLVSFADRSGDNGCAEFGYAINASYPTTINFANVEKYLSKNSNGTWSIAAKNLISGESEFWGVYNDGAFDSIELSNNKYAAVSAGTIFYVENIKAVKFMNGIKAIGYGKISGGNVDFEHVVFYNTAPTTQRKCTPTSADKDMTSYVPSSSYTFNGWYKDSSLATKVDLSTTTKVVAQSGDIFYLSVTKNRTISGSTSTVTYKITASATEGGKISDNGVTKVEKGDEITYKATASNGYEFEKFVVDGKDVVVAGTKYTFENVKAAHTIKAVFITAEEEEDTPACTFIDVKENDWFNTPVYYVANKGLMNGMGESIFSPNTNTTRGMMATILYRMSGSPEITASQIFSDVESTSWYSTPIIWAQENGIVSGYGDGIFKPEANITREQLAKMIYSYAKQSDEEIDSEDLKAELKFADTSKISSWAYESICWCQSNGIMKGRNDNTFDPQGLASRAEIAQVIMNYMER